MTVQPDPSLRPLHIDFDVYTEGDDAFKEELGMAILKNMEEFRQTLPDAIQQGNPQLFLQGCHKVKVSLSMLADQEFDEIIEKLQKGIVTPGNATQLATWSDHFQRICGLIITSLRSELNAVGK